MTKLSLALFAVVAVPAVLSAQTFESRVADASSQARLGVQGLPTTYAKTIVCANTPKDAGLPGALKFYTYLGTKAPRAAAADDTASRLNDYRSSYAKDGKWHFDAWSCDTQDYWFDFRVSDLVRGSASERTRAIKGHVRVETRGQVDFDGELDCVASW